jgi:hypothetical protein
MNTFSRTDVQIRQVPNAPPSEIPITLARFVTFFFVFGRSRDLHLTNQIFQIQHIAYPVG